MNTSAIELTDLSKRYTKLVAVDQLNLTVKKGEIFGFLGPNGAGKSTTLRMILSLISPSAGEIQIFGKSLLKSRKEALSNMGCIIEKPDFYLYLSATENLRILSQLNAVPKPLKRINEVIDLVGLNGRENDKVKTYSHGMKQRLGLAQALLHDPQLVILDEPTTGLDPQGIIELRHLLVRLKNEFGKTIVLSSHILSEVELIADSMVIMNRGKAVAQGSVQALLSSENLLVKIELENSENVLQLLQETAYLPMIVNSESSNITFTMSRSQIPDLNTFLIQNQIKVYGISYQRPLEEYFLKITQAGGKHA